MRFVDFYLEGKYKNNPLRNVLKEAEYLSQNGVRWLSKGNDEKFQRFRKQPTILLKSLCLCFVCIWVLLSCFSRASTLILGTPKDYNSPLSLQGRSQKGWVQFSVRIFETVTWGSQCVIFLSFVLSNGATMSRKSDHVICVGLRTLRKEASGFKRMKSQRSNPLKTSSLSMMKKVISLPVSRQNSGGHQLELM